MLRRLIAAAALAVPAAASAQATECRIPPVLPRPTVEGATEREPKRLLPIAGYTLALSWSPEYCRTRTRSARDRIQCGGGNRFGFTLHGLWPDGPGKDWPQYCRPAALLPDPVVRGALCATPSPQLLQHEWAKHGTCTGNDPGRYFGTATRLYRGIAYPDMDTLSRRPQLSAAAFRRAFADANPGMSAAMMRLNVNRRGWLEEVWLCLGPDLKQRRCPGTGEGAAASATVRIWRGRSQPVNDGSRRPRSSRSRDDGDRDGGG